MNHNLAVCVLGNPDSGKSHTWNLLFNRTVRTGSELRRLYLTAIEYVEVFLISGSPEERDIYVGEIITVRHPRIILCSMQYIAEVQDTIQYFRENDYFLYLQWLNPGYNDPFEVPCFDILGLTNKILSNNSMISIRDAKTDPKSSRVLKKS